MKFKSHNRSSPMPELNLVPMIDLIMTVLTFFIVVSMTLTSGTGSIDVQLPKATDNQKSDPNQTPPDQQPIRQVIYIDAAGSLFLAKEQLNIDQIEARVFTYLKETPNGSIVISADQKVPYDRVMQVLNRLRSAGGSRVSLLFNKA
jgi:biopolymer transport protein ExbD